ncbi:MAG: radical SAM protein [Holophagales bacterium]|nr:radical SAM protein [Holophagales bacterium]
MGTSEVTAVLRAAPPGQRPGRVLKVVFGLDCTGTCSYCALKTAHGFPRARRSRLDPALAEAKIHEAAQKYEISGLEVGAGETFDQPELWEWLLALNGRELNVPVMAFTGGLSKQTPRVLDAIAASSAPVLLLFSYDGRRSERNAANWPEVEAAFRAMKARLSGASHVTLKLTACVTPRDARRLNENFLSLLDLEPAPFAFRPLKRSFNDTEREDFVRQLAAFLDEASNRGVRLLSAPEAGEWHLGLKRDWTCHRLGVSLLPDGRFTDCYVTWYCSDFPTWRTLPSLEGLDRFFTQAEAPAPAACARCLDVFDLCNLCPAGLADFRRSTGESFYDGGFCRMVNRSSLLLLGKALEERPGLEAVVRRGGVETRLRREGRALVLTGPNGNPPLSVDPRAGNTMLPIA